MRTADRCAAIRELIAENIRMNRDLSWGLERFSMGLTRREFDAMTRENWGGDGMARDERCHYRARRGLEHNGSGSSYATATPRDHLADRQAWAAAHPGEAVLGIGSKYRAPANFRLLGRLPTLPPSLRKHPTDASAFCYS